MEQTQEQEKKSQETTVLQTLISIEDLLEKKTKIYSRLLMDVALAKEMEELSLHHQTRKAELETLLYGKSKTKKGGSKQ